MKEILFRGKRVDNGEWVEGYFAHFVNTKNESQRIYGRFSETDCGNFYPEFWEIDPKTVGQYTGLTDKNGKKIFEGDICGCFCNTQMFAVEYCAERCGYFFDDCILSGGCDPAPECLGNLQGTIEIIGNIYDNPELLEER